MGAGGGDVTDEFMTANGVRVSHQGHLPFAGAVKGIYETLKALREGADPASLASEVASPSMIGQLTRRADYERWTNEFLN